MFARSYRRRVLALTLAVGGVNAACSSSPPVTALVTIKTHTTVEEMERFSIHVLDESGDYTGRHYDYERREHPLPTSFEVAPRSDDIHRLAPISVVGLHGVAPVACSTTTIQFEAPSSDTELAAGSSTTVPQRPGETEVTMWLDPVRGGDQEQGPPDGSPPTSKSPASSTTGEAPATTGGGAPAAGGMPAGGDTTTATATLATIAGSLNHARVDICAPTSKGCDNKPLDLAFGGTKNKVYSVTLHVQGTVSLTQYTNGSSVLLDSGALGAVGGTLTSITGSFVTDGGGPFSASELVVRLIVNNPGASKTYYLNSAPSGGWVDKVLDVDYRVTIPIDGQAKLTLAAVPGTAPQLGGGQHFSANFAFGFGFGGGPMGPGTGPGPGSDKAQYLTITVE